jgi:hypothetical protein
MDGSSWLMALVPDHYSFSGHNSTFIEHGG